jgi:hypothetical protein
VAKKGPIPRNDLPANVPGVQPELPGDRLWVDGTLEWWRALADTPEAANFTQLDWIHLALVARILDDFFQQPSRQLLDSIRLYLSKFGLSPEDRARLHVPQPAPPVPEDDAPRKGSRSRPDPRLSAT